jgi:hypothetical protein
MSRKLRTAVTAALMLGSLVLGVQGALAAVTPGWECVPTTAGANVTSGGTGASPSCASGTAVLAPTYVAGGVGGKPTVEFSTVNVQVISGSGSTSGAVNGEGNLVVGYAESPSKYAQTGSNDLVVGTNNGWSGYGELLAGTGDRAGGAYASTFGQSNQSNGPESVTAGNHNVAAAAQSSVLGGEYNTASDAWASVLGGCDNIAGAGATPVGPCSNRAEAVLGGASNHATGVLSTISGGQSNQSTGDEAAVAGGLSNFSEGTSTVVAGGYANTAGFNQSTIAGGGENTTTGDISSILGGYYNTATADEAVVAGGCDNLSGPGNVAQDNSRCFNFNDSFMAVLGGVGNYAAKVGSTITGGEAGSITGGTVDALVGGSAESLTGAGTAVSQVGATPFTP